MDGVQTMAPTQDDPLGGYTHVEGHPPSFLQRMLSLATSLAMSPFRVTPERCYTLRGTSSTSSIVVSWALHPIINS